MRYILQTMRFIQIKNKSPREYDVPEDMITKFLS